NFKPVDFTIHINSFIEAGPPDELYFQNSDACLPLKTAQAESTRIEFHLCSITDNETLFAPLAIIRHPAGETIIDRSNKQILGRAGHAFYCIDPRGTLLHKKRSALYARFMTELFTTREPFTAGQISALSDFAEEHLKDHISISFTPRPVRIMHARPQPFVELETQKQTLLCKLRFDYQGHSCSSTDPESMLTTGKANDKEIRIIQRDNAFETLVKDYLHFNGFSMLPNLESYDDFYYDHDEFGESFGTFPGGYRCDLNLRDFLTQYGRILIDGNIEIRLKESGHRIGSGKGSLSLQVTSGIDWFDAHLTHRSENGEEVPVTIDPASLQQGLLKIGNAYTIINQKDINRIMRLQQEGLDKNGTMRISNYNLSLIDELYADITDKTPELKSAKKLASKLKNTKGIKALPVPRAFNGTLRSYQKAGYAWLNFLHEHSLNGCLADDMGLGKTVQTLAFLQKLKGAEKLGTCLLVVPVSTIANWESEIERFTPRLSFIRFAGSDRIKDPEALQQHDLIILSYHTLRLDIKLFHEIPLNYVILDEAQAIKNASSQAFKAVRTLPAQHRLSLTGTPVENNTLELWSQMDFLNPGLLGTIKNFKARFARPIEKDGDPHAAEQLRKTVFPFILRRKKEDVETDLPEKEIITIYSEMESKQQALYTSYRETYRQKIADTISDKGVGRSAIEIFEALLRLRQIALFPVLADAKYKNVPSCKFESLKDMLDDIFSEDHKALLFSQFVKSLKLIEDHVKKEKIGYTYLDGQTKKRAEAIKKFQRDPDTNIFLLSLKAGGTGINLTAADYVILFDPWWNPAVEHQAIDRAHRIGQKRKVIAYKLIVRNTVEEKILALQEKKSGLVKELIQEDSSFFKKLTPDDVLDLFS
ncbi:MAG: DEAD/DEAH box helicase, partial [Deltaproteobacteria bacterium]|nr:DEAD/DEAH box helicase [Deltaproteobacteria bacterium]